MQHREGSFVGAQGANIYHQCWLPAADPVALILVAHGAAEHGGRYEHFAKHFTAQGYAVAALDHFGHGKSEGGRCCLRRLDDHVENLESFRKILQADFAQPPMILLGHSMGGLIACCYLLKYQAQLACCVLSGPAIQTELTPPWHQIALIRLKALMSPDEGVLQLDAAGVSRLPEEVERYRNDPLNYGGMLSARLVSELYRGMDLVQSRAHEISLPLLILHGGADVMTSPRGSELLHERAGSAQKQLHIYPEAYHEIFNEPEKDEVFATIGTWLDSVVSR